MTTTFAKVSYAEKLRAALPVLLAARRAVVFEGTLPIDAIQNAGEAGIASWFARELLLRVVPAPTIQLWQSDPLVKQSDRTRAFDRAIRLARGAFGHCGGWRLSDPSHAAPTNGATHGR